MVSPQESWESLVIRDEPSRAIEPQPDLNLPASYLTHELRAPVTAIRLGLEILQEQLDHRLKVEEGQMLALAIKNTSRLEVLVNDILDYSKMAAGKMKFQSEPCNARPLVNEAVEGLQALALSQGVKLVKSGGEPLPRIWACPRRIVQILINLLSNAVKFTPARGTVTVSVSQGRYEHEGTLLFKVKDTGCGISAKDIDGIFTLFTQTKGVKTSSISGSGLGLALSRQMVELHGGRIWAESWPGLGTTLFFTIPITAEDRSRKTEVYPKPIEYSGLLVSLGRRVNAFLALFV